MSKRKENCLVLDQEEISPGIYSLWLQTEQIAKEARPGQFVSLYCQGESRLLPRPISLCEMDKEKGRIRLVYRVIGEGTKEFSRLTAGDDLEVLGPLGNGFPLEECRGKKVVLLGGGIGIPPMLEVAKQLDQDVTIVAGYRNAPFLQEDFRAYGTFMIATEDGSAGIQGNVLDVLRARKLSADVLMACGPTPMLRAVQAYAAQEKIPCWISLEERMACGVGACLGCVCRSKEADTHSQVHNKRVCKDGPVFLSTEVELP